MPSAHWLFPCTACALLFTAVSVAVCAHRCAGPPSPGSVSLQGNVNLSGHVPGLSHPNRSHPNLELVAGGGLLLVVADLERCCRHRRRPAQRRACRIRGRASAVAAGPGRPLQPTLRPPPLFSSPSRPGQPDEAGPLRHLVASCPPQPIIAEHTRHRSASAAPPWPTLPLAGRTPPRPPTHARVLSR